MKKHFVTFYSPGTFVSEQTEKPIDSWDVEKAKEMSRRITERYNSKPFGFRFSTRERSASELDSKVTKESGMYYLGGRILTLEDVKKEMPKEHILIFNMEGNGLDRVVLNDNSWRTIQPFEKGDTVLDFQ